MSLYGHAACTTALKCSMFNFIMKTSHFAYLGMLFYLFIYALMLVAPSLRLWKTHRVLVYKFVVIMVIMMLLHWSLHLSSYHRHNRHKRLPRLRAIALSVSKLNKSSSLYPAVQGTCQNFRFATCLDLKFFVH